MGRPRAGFDKHTSKELLVGPGVLYANWGMPNQKVLGATDGGTSFNFGQTYRNIEFDKPFKNVKGLKTIDDIMPVISGNLMQVSSEKLAAFLPNLKEDNMPKTAPVQNEAIAGADGTKTVFVLANDKVQRFFHSVKIGSEYLDTSEYSIFNVGEAGHSGTSGVTGAEIVFDKAPPTGAISISYAYDTGVATTHRRFRAGEVTDESYLSNVALIAEMNGKEQPFIAIIYNALSDGNFELDFQLKDETVIPITFEGHFREEDVAAYYQGKVTLEQIAPVSFFLPIE